MGNIDYKKLYGLQDRVLDTVFGCKNEFMKIIEDISRISR